MESKEAFSEQTIEEDQPDILRDFETFLNFVTENNLPASGKLELLPLKCLPELNALLSKPFDIDLKRPVQKSFANINGLYLLARTSGLLILKKSGKNLHFAIDEEALKSWQSLNPTERYFTLVETWMVRSSAETIGEHGGFLDYPHRKLIQLYNYIGAKGLKYKDDKSFFEQSLSFFGLYNIALAEMFGWLEIKYGKGEKEKGWVIKQIKFTNFGLAFIAFLQDILQDYYFGLQDTDLEGNSDFDKNTFNLLQKKFQAYFPKWKNAYRLPKLEMQEGIFVFKVSLRKTVWRRIAIASDEFLDDLHEVIQTAFDFDSDHLYEFIFRNRFGQKQRVAHPMCDEEFHTDEFRIKELPLRIGETMKYVFDFGDNWKFTIELEEIKPPDPKFKYSEILEEHGKSPEQYPDWEDEW